MYRLTSHFARVKPSIARTARQNTSIRLASSSSKKPTRTSTLPAEQEFRLPDELRAHYAEFPNLMTPDPLMDLRQVLDVSPNPISPHQSQVNVWNDPRMLDAYHDVAQVEEDFGERAEEHVYNPAKLFTEEEMRRLHIYPLLTRSVVQQTGKGKIRRPATLVVVGNGNGLFGIGEAKGHDMNEVRSKARENAIRNMDWVDLFEQRTLWTEMEGKLGATKIILRPRPVGFGLAVNPIIHQVFKAAGIKDASAKVWGSRNPYQVIRLLMQMLHPGSAPISMGDGIGGSGRRLESGRGMRGKDDVQRERGRKMVNLYSR